MRTANRTIASTNMTVTEPRTEIYTDFSGKIRTRSITGMKYFVLFIDTYTGAKCVDFLVSKSHFTHAYNRLIAYLGHYPKILCPWPKFSRKNHTNQIVCAKDEHYGIGVVESAVGTLRVTAKAMLLQANIPKKLRPFAVSHASYFNNIIYPSQTNKSITTFEAPFHKKADVRRIPPFGSFTCVYKDRRSLQDQSFNLTSTQGVFIEIARYNKVLEYCITAGTTVSVTRDSIASNPHFFPFCLRANASSFFSPNLKQQELVFNWQLCRRQLHRKRISLMNLILNFKSP